MAGDKRGPKEKKRSVERKRWGSVGRKQDSPEVRAVVLKELWLDVGEEKVWFTGEGKELVVGLLGRLGGNESLSAASSSKGSG